MFFHMGFEECKDAYNVEKYNNNTMKATSRSEGQDCRSDQDSMVPA